MIGSTSPAAIIRKAVLLAGAAAVMLVLILRYQGYRNIIVQAEKLTLTTLESAAWGIAQTLDGDSHEQLVAAYPNEDDITSTQQDARYDKLHNKLAEAHKTLGLETPIYTYAKDRQTNAFLFIGTSARKPYFKHPFSSAPPKQLAAYGKPMKLPVYTDPHGKWLSATAPIFNSEQEVVAMVQVDRCFDRFIAEAEKEALGGLWWNILLIACLVLMVWKYVSVLVIKEENDKIALQAIIDEKTILSERLALREVELERQKAMLVDKNQYLEDFANIASHDLKSPLRGISNFAGLLSRRLGTNVESSVTEYITFIKSNATRAMKLVDGILKYSKLGVDAQQNEPCCLHELASNAIENLHSVVQERNARIELNSTLPRAVCDPVIVTQLFQNLIGNGLKYNQSDTPAVHISCSKDQQGRLVIAVEDNGIGIPEEYQKGIFEMFKRLHSGGDEYEGSGIGLAFCLRIINSYGGEIWLESEEGVGSTFYFTLPDAFVDVKTRENLISTF